MRAKLWDKFKNKPKYLAAVVFLSTILFFCGMLLFASHVQAASAYAMVNGTQYSKLEDAINAAGNGDTIYISGALSSDQIRLDKSLKFTTVANTNGRIQYKDLDGDSSNGNMSSEGYYDNYLLGVANTNTKKITLTFEGNGSGVLTLDANYAEVTIPTNKDNQGNYAMGNIVQVANNVTCNLNNNVKLIDCKNTGDIISAGIKVLDGGTLVIDGATITDCYRGVTLNEGASFGMVSGTINSVYRGIYSHAGVLIYGGTISGGTGALTLDGSTASAGIYGGTFSTSGDSAHCISLTDGANLAMSNGTANGCKKNGINVSGSTATISGGTFSSNGANGVAVSNSGTANISGGTFNSNTDCGVYCSSGTLNITGGTFKNNNYGIQSYGGSLNMSGAVSVDTSNPIRLNKEQYITINGSLTASTVGNICPESITNNTIVAKKTYSGGYASNLVGKFGLVNTSGTANPSGYVLRAGNTASTNPGVSATDIFISHAYTVTYNAGGGTVSKTSTTCYYNELVDLTPIASKSEKTFAGWMESATGTSVVRTKYMPASNLTLYPLFVTPVSDVANHTYPNYNKNLTGYKDVIVTIYETNSSGSKTGNSVSYEMDYTEDASHMTYNYTINKSIPYSYYTVVVIGYDNAGNSKIIYTNDSNPPPPPPAYEYFTQEVLYYLYADWSGELVKEIRNNDGDVLSQAPKNTAKDILKGNTYQIVTTPVPAGYEVDGTYSNYTVSEDKSTTVTYKPKNYTITFNANGGTCEKSSQAITYTGYYNKYGDLPEPQREHYDFTGWYNETTKEYVKDSTILLYTGNVTLKATWEPVKYQVIYDFQTNNGDSWNGPSDGIIMTAYNSEVDLSFAAEKEGWDFVGWNTNEKAEEGLTSLIMPGEGITLYAIYKKTITMNFTDQSGTTSISGTMWNTDTSVSLEYPAITPYENWIAVSWNVTDDDSSVYNALNAEGGMEDFFESVDFKAYFEKKVTASFIIPEELDYGIDDIETTLTLTTGEEQTEYFVELPVLDNLSNSTFIGWEDSEGTVFDILDKPSDEIWGKSYKESVTLTSVYDNYPTLIVSDRYFTLEDAKAGAITDANLLSTAVVEDEEDEKKGVQPAVSLIGYDASEFTSLTSNATISIEYKAVDSRGNTVTKTATVHVVDTTAHDSEITQEARFIESRYLQTDVSYLDADNDGYVDGKGNTSDYGGLRANSNWKTNSLYSTALSTALTDRDTKEAIPGMVYIFTPEQINEAKTFVEENGFADFLFEGARKLFISTFLTSEEDINTEEATEAEEYPEEVLETET